MDDEYFRLLAVIVIAILTVSLLMNFLLASDPAAVQGPPLRIYGYFNADGSPAAGYYTTTPGIHPAGETSDGTLPVAAPTIPVNP